MSDADVKREKRSFEKLDRVEKIDSECGSEVDCLWKSQRSLEMNLH
jgi:hypothetical protein